MSSRAYQSDLFDPPRPAPAAPTRLPPYSLEELAALGEQMRGFERFPDDWCPGWWDMYDRARSTVWHAPREQQEALRDGVFFREAERLLRIETREAEQAEAAKAPPKRARRSARSVAGG